MLLLSRLSRQDLRVNSPKKNLLYKPIEINFRTDIIIVISRFVRAHTHTHTHTRFVMRTGDTFDDEPAHSCIGLFYRDLLSRIAGVLVPLVRTLSSRWLPNVILPLACLLSLSMIFSKCIYFRQ